MEGIEAGLFFPGGAGGSTLMARESCRLTAEAFQQAGGAFQIGKVVANPLTAGDKRAISLENGEKIED